MPSALFAPAAPWALKRCWLRRRPMEDSLPARMADRVLCIGPAPSTGSYLHVGTIVEAALGSGSDAIHPGYGFLAEQPELSQACIDNGIVFIGPKSLDTSGRWETSWRHGRLLPTWGFR